MSIEVLVVAGIALFGFMLGCALPVRVIWIIAPVVVLSFVYAVVGSGDSEIPALFWLFGVIVSVGWSVVVIGGRGLRRLMRQ